MVSYRIIFVYPLTFIFYFSKPLYATNPYLYCIILGGKNIGYNKANMLNLMEDVKCHTIDIRKTIGKAAKLQGEKSLFIFDNRNRMHSYSEFARKKEYKFDFLSDRFFDILNKYYVSNNGIFISLVNGHNLSKDGVHPRDLVLKNLPGDEKIHSDWNFTVAEHYGIKISQNDNVEFACVFYAHACGYGAVRVFRTIGQGHWSHHADSIDNPVNFLAVPTVYNEIVFDE